VCRAASVGSTNEPGSSRSVDHAICADTLGGSTCASTAAACSGTRKTCLKSASCAPTPRSRAGLVPVVRAADRRETGAPSGGVAGGGVAAAGRSAQRASALSRTRAASPRAERLGAAAALCKDLYVDVAPTRHASTGRRRALEQMSADAGMRARDARPRMCLGEVSNRVSNRVSAGSCSVTRRQPATPPDDDVPSGP